MMVVHSMILCTRYQSWHNHEEDGQQQAEGCRMSPPCRSQLKTGLVVDAHQHTSLKASGTHALSLSWLGYRPDITSQSSRGHGHARPHQPSTPDMMTHGHGALDDVTRFPTPGSAMLAAAMEKGWSKRETNGMGVSVPDDAPLHPGQGDYRESKLDRGLRLEDPSTDEH